MLSQPKWWSSHYRGNADQQRLARRYSYSDRLRYYWHDPMSRPLSRRSSATCGIPLYHSR